MIFHSPLIDDKGIAFSTERHEDIASASTLDKEVSKGTKTEQAVVVGKLVAERAVAKGISEVVFDRGGYLYHGRVKALADSARENGLKF